MATLSDTTSTEEKQPRWNGLSLRAHLLLLLLLALIPAIGTIAFSLWQSGNTLQTVSRQVLQQGAYTVATAVRGELQSTSDLLNSFAATEASPGQLDLITQYNRAASGRSGRVLVLDARDDAQNLAGIPKDFLQRSQSLGQPSVSNLFSIAENGALRVAIAAPSPSTVDDSRMVALMLPPERLSQAIGKRDAALQHILVALTDGEGRIIARSRDPERFVGKRAPDWDRLQAMKSSSGTFQATTTEGNSIVFAFQQIEGTPGWMVVVGEPQELFDARWREPLNNLFWAAGLSIIIALIASFAAARLVLRPIAALVERGRKVADGDPTAAEIVVPHSTVSEFQVLSQSIEKAEATLLHRAEAERLAGVEIGIRERRYRALAEVGALVFWRRARNGRMLASDGWNQLTGKVHGISGYNWLNDVFLDDRLAVDEAWREATRHNGNIDVEFRIISASGEWHWVRARGAPVRDDKDHVVEWTGVLEDVHERRLAQARITHMAHHDALTGLSNRLHFSEMLTQTITHHKEGQMGGAILCIDLDRFKEVNDTLGHAAGDKLLITATKRLQANVKKNDVIARLGGDEFVVLQAFGNQPVAATALAGRLIEKLSEPYDLDGQRAVIGASIGITLIGTGADTPEHLMQQGDMALYRAKEEGRQQFAFFEPGMDARMQERRRREMDLRRGMAAGEFDLVYQPIFESDARILVGYEALLRWKHPERGVLLPQNFLKLAEEISLIIPLGQSVMYQACADAARWPKPLKVAVNISSVQLCKSGFSDMVLECLKECGLDHHRLELEIPEEALIHNPTAAFGAMNTLKRAGVRIVMDHFGTGASSIGHLRTFPFDKVKIDASFVQGLEVLSESDAIVSAITSLCSTIGIPVAAQGVETERQLQILASYTRLEIQGHLLGKPIDTPSMEGFHNDQIDEERTNARIIDNKD